MTAKLDTDYQAERKARFDCEGRLTKLEATNDAVAIIEEAKVAANKIRFDAAAARDVLATAASKAKKALADEE